MYRIRILATGEVHGPYVDRDEAYWQARLDLHLGTDEYEIITTEDYYQELLAEKDQTVAAYRNALETLEKEILLLQLGGQ